MKEHVTRGNQIRLVKAAKELTAIAHSKEDAQSKQLAIFRVLELVMHVQIDLAFRPEVNS